MVVEPFALGGVPLQGELQADGEVAAVAGDYGTVIFQQVGQQALGEGDLLIVEDDHSDVFDGTCGDCLLLHLFREVAFLHFRQFDDHLMVFQRQIGRIAET